MEAAGVAVAKAVVVNHQCRRRRHRIRAATRMHLNKAVGVEVGMGTRSTDRVVITTIIALEVQIRVALLTALSATKWRALLALPSMIGHITAISRSINHASGAV